MAKGANQKIKILKLLEILRNESDETHPISTNKLIYRLQEFGIDVERKALYDDIKTLNEWGYEIVCVKNDHSNCYFSADCEFDLAELKILTDAVQSANFITPKKTKTLCEKIAAQGGNYKAEILRQNIVYYDKQKHTNEKIYYSVDAINSAMCSRKKISFRYFDFGLDGQRIYRKNGARYIVSPAALVLSDNNYYLTCVSDNHDDLSNYRVDKMDQVEVEMEDITVNCAELLEFNNNPKRAFSMFLGREEKVTLVMENELANAVVDKFGEKTKMVKLDEKNFSLKISVQLSPTFFAWCFTFGDKLKITEPENVAAKMKEYAETVFKMYAE